MITFDEMSAKLKTHGINILDLEKQCNYPRWYLPFLYVYGRKDSTISIMGANIYPEDVENIIFSDDFLAKKINSFSLSLTEDSQGNPRPCFDFELFDTNFSEEVQSKVQKLLPEGLCKLSLDYKKASEEYPEALTPIIRTYGLNEGVFQQNQKRIKKRYIQ